MSKIAVLLRNYIPDNNAITYVINPTIQELSKNNEIDIFCLGKIGAKKSEVFDNNIRVYRIMNGNKVDYFFSKLVFKLFNNDSNRMINLRKYKKFVEKKFKKNNYEMIISSSFPFCLHEIAYDIKKKYHVKWIAYQFDPYTYNNFVINRKKFSHEKKILELSDAIFLPRENYHENINNGFEMFKNKYKIVNYPIIDLEINKKYSSILKIVYAGVLYDKLREPFIPMEILSHIKKEKELELHYICSQDLNDKIEKASNNYKFLKLFRNSPKSECNNAIENATILLNIGNKSSNQTPSKVFEYISYCKPIINFYYDDNDTSYNILKKYPLAVNYKIGDKIDSMLETRIDEIINSKISFEELKKIYPEEALAPKNNANFINSILNKK